MYLELAPDTVVRKKEVIGIFDLDTSTVMKNTRDYLARAEKSGQAETVTLDLPKSFTVTSIGKNDQKIYISKYTTDTLAKR